MQMRLARRRKLRSLMVVHKVSLRTLATIAGYASHAHMGRIVRGETDVVPTESARRISEHFELDTSELFAPIESTTGGRSKRRRTAS